MQWLKQSTAIYIQLGPFLDDGDGKTAETGLTISQADVKVSKGGAAFAQKTDANAAVHDAGGWYRCQLDATDTGTLGRLIVAVHESGALPVWREFIVVPSNVWDSMFSTDKLQVDATQIEGGDATDAINAAVDAALNTAIPGSPVAGSVNERVVAIDDLTQGSGSGDLAAILGDTNALQADWVNGGRLDLLIDATLADTNELQTDDIPGKIAGLNDPTAAAIADAVWDEALAAHDTEDSVGNVINDMVEESDGTYRLTEAALAEAPSGAGAGAITFTYTLTSSVDGTAVSDADVWVTTDEAGSNVVASGTTDTSGEVVFYLDTATYYIWRQKAGWDFDNPDTEAVS